LEGPRPDPHWLDAIEHETAEVAVAVAAQRAETVARLQQALAARDDPASVFPASEIALKGWIEELVRQRPALEVEDRYREVLKDNRARDAAAGRTLDGPHLTDLTVTHARKGVPAADASTGEQKALLIGLVLAHASLLTEMSGFAPVLLLDEVVAHLDPQRRTALYGELERLGAQVWMTGADPAAFAELERRAQFFEVSPGRVAARA
jgi:DNA replication and repair protein RecF